MFNPEKISTPKTPKQENGPKKEISETKPLEKPEISEEESISVENIGKRKSEYGDYYVSDIERLIMGERIPDTQRKVFPNSETTSHWESGSIGFLDFGEEGKTISVGEMGIEPEYRGKGYSKELIKKVEEIAKEREVENIKFIAVEENNAPMIELLKKYEYTPSRGFNPEIFIKKIRQSKNKESDNQ